MKHTLYLLLSCCILFVCFSQKANAQKVYPISFIDSCGPPTLYISTDSITLGGSAVKFEVSYGDGTRDTTTVTRFTSMFKHNYVTAGTYTVKAVLMNS